MKGTAEIAYKTTKRTKNTHTHTKEQKPFCKQLYYDDSSNEY